MTSRPSTANGAGPSSVPLIKSFRFSSSHDVHSVPLANGATPTASKRSSKLQEYLGRSRTASLPPRPHTSGGLPGHKRFTLTGKTKEVADDESQGSVASSSIASGELIDRFFTLLAMYPPFDPDGFMVPLNSILSDLTPNDCFY